MLQVPTNHIWTLIKDLVQGSLHRRVGGEGGGWGGFARGAANNAVRKSCNLSEHGGGEALHTRQVNGHGGGDEQQQQAQRPVLHCPDDRRSDGEPEQHDGNDLGAARHGAVEAVVEDEGTENTVRGDPLVKPGGTAQKETGSEEQEGRGGQHGNENAERAQQETGEAGGDHQAAFQGGGGRGHAVHYTRCDRRLCNRYVRAGCLFGQIFAIITV